MNTGALCKSVVDLAKERCPQLVHKAEFIEKTFLKAFTLFAQCRKIYDSGKVIKENTAKELRK